MLGSCATNGTSAAAPEGLPIGTRIALPENAKALGNVACTFYKTGGSRGLEQFDIRCPGWERAAGLVWRGDLPRPATGWEEAFFNQSDLAKTVHAEADCGAPESTRILNDQAAYARRCTSHNGGFPYLLIASGIAGRAFVLWGPAHLAPLFEDFILASAQGAALEKLPGSRSQLIALAEQSIIPEGRLIGLEDMGQFTALDELSTLYNSAKNHPRALELAQRALEIHERVKGADHPSGGYLVARMARELSRLQPGAAEAMFRRAELLVKASPDASDQPELLVYWAWHELDRGHPTQAEQYAQQSWELSQTVAARSQQDATNPRIAHSLVGIGDVYRELGKLTEAESAYQQALKIFDAGRGGDYHWVGECHQRLAEIYRRRQSFDQARAQAQAAVELKRALFGEGRALAEALMTQANVEHAAGQSQRALAFWREARRILLDHPTALAQLKTEEVVGYLEVLFELADAPDAANSKTALLDEAFAVSQLGQTPAAGRAVTQVAARLAETDPEVREAARALQDDLKTRQDLQYELGLEQSKPFLARDAAKEEALKAKLRTATEAYQRQEERLQAQFPRYGRLITPAPLNAAKVAKLLRRNEALLRVLPGAKETWIFLVKADGTLRGAAVKLPTQQLTEKVERLRAGVNASAGSIPHFDLTLAHELYQQLLGPLEPALADIHHLIVVPAGALLSLPPTLLVRQAPTNLDDYRQAAWLVRDMALSVLPSVVALEQFRQVAGASQARLPFIGFGDPVFSQQTGALRGGGGGVDRVIQNCQLDAKALSQLPQLPETATELRTLARTLGAKQKQEVILGQQATVSAVQTGPLQNYRIIAFATHALLPGELDCLNEPALALTPQTSVNAGDHGLLGASTIATLKLDAEWVLLSACNTAGAGGGSLRGEGLSGLATAFFYAGTRSLLASHWYVVSEPTVFLTTHTFDSYQKAPYLGRAEALRRAQLALLEQPNMAHPVFWAAFTLIGESSPSQ